jgi:tetratricopeptide (TPR) repeat protein
MAAEPPKGDRPGERRRPDGPARRSSGQPYRGRRDDRERPGRQSGRPRPRPERVADDGPAAEPAPRLPDGVDPHELDPDIRRDLRGLRKEIAETVAQHLVAAGMLLDEDPEQALRHARYARRRASRIAAVREAAGIAAYGAGEWSEALAELRAARRMGGGPGHLALMADIERALGRPERALELARSPEARDLPGADAVELMIVAAGARRDLGDVNAAVRALEIGELDPAKRSEWSPRLFYAYADNLLAAGRRDEAISWFLHAAEADDEELTDAAERLQELTGETSAP